MTSHLYPCLPKLRPFSSATMNKRRRLPSPPPSPQSKSPPPPSTELSPSTPPPPSTELSPSTPPPPPPPTPPKATPIPTSKSKTQRSLLLDSPWSPLPLPRSELSLPLTLPTGQTFRWRRTAPDHFTGVVGPHLLSLKHINSTDSIAFLTHASGPGPGPAPRDALADYLNAGVCLGEMWLGFADSDARFKEVVAGFDGGARVLRQDPVECLLQFLCSSNNNIARIEKMVGVLSGYGEFLGTVGGFDFHVFPTLERLGKVEEQELREVGFGYRAKYIVGAVKVLQAKPGGGAQWLASLRELELHEVIDALCTLPGVGPKVAACVALFSLDQHHAIPVDTHVWQIATRYLLPELAGMSLTTKLHSRVAEAFVSKYGRYAGWAQNVLFISELPTQKALRPLHSVTVQKKKPAKRKQKRNKLDVEATQETRVQ